MPQTVLRATEVESDFVVEQTIRVLEGVPAKRVYRYKTDTGGSIADLSLASATEITLTIKKHASTDDADAIVVHRLSDADGVITVSSPSTWGQIEFRIPAADVVAPGHFYYRLDVAFPDGVRTIGRGPFIVENT